MQNPFYFNSTAMFTEIAPSAHVLNYNRPMVDIQIGNELTI